MLVMTCGCRFCRDRGWKRGRCGVVLGRNGGRETYVGPHQAWRNIIKSAGAKPTNGKLSGSLSEKARGELPEVEVVNRSLLVPHKDIERKKVNRRQGPATQDLEESRKAVSRSSHDAFWSDCENPQDGSLEAGKTGRGVFSLFFSFKRAKNK